MKDSPVYTLEPPRVCLFWFLVQINVSISVT
jgi:hypothetical protein